VKNKELTFDLQEGYRVKIVVSGAIYIYIQEHYKEEDKWINLSDMYIVESDFDKFADSIEKVRKLMVLA
jgi:hypothetical protein